MDDSTSSTARQSPADHRPASDLGELQWLRAENIRLQGEFARGSIAVRKILDSIPVCVAYVDADGRYQFINGTYAKCFGLTEADFVGQRLRDAHGPERWSRMRDAVGRVLGGEPQSFELHLDASNGRSFELIVQYVPHVDEQAVNRGFFIVTEDITAQREDARKVEWSEQLLREALGSAKMMAWEWDARSRATTRTSNAEQVLGFVPEATQTSIADYIHPRRCLAHARHTPRLRPANDSLPRAVPPSATRRWKVALAGNESDPAPDRTAMWSFVA